MRKCNWSAGLNQLGPVRAIYFPSFKRMENWGKKKPSLKSKIASSSKSSTTKRKVKITLATHA